MTDYSELVESLESVPDGATKFFLAGFLAQYLLKVEAHYSYRTGDGNRLCRHEKAVAARAGIDRIAQFMKDQQ